MSKDNFLKGAAVLVFANFIVKIIGVVYKIPLTNIMGGEGMGYFSSAFDIYLIFFSFSTAGLPVALSKMIAESKSLGRFSEIHKILKVTFGIFLSIGILGAVVVFFGAGTFASFISNDLAKYSLMALAPTLFFICVASIFRGYFQGLQDMKPTAISQVGEAIVKLIVGISLAYYALNLGFGDEYISAFAILGTTASTIISVLILILIFNAKKNKTTLKDFRKIGGEERSYKELSKTLIKIVIPITFGAVVVNLTGFLDLFLIIRRLQDIGYTQAEANFVYGSYKACAYTLFNLPPSIITTFNLTLIPIITTAFATKNKENLESSINKGVKITAIFALPCAVAFIAFANPLLHLMFPGKLEEIEISTRLLQCLGIALPLVTMSTMFTAILQSIGKEKLPVRAILIASTVKIILNYTLIGIPSINILGAPIGTIVCYLIIMLLNLSSIKKYSSINFNMKKNVLKPLISALFMGVISYVCYFSLNIITNNMSLSMLITVPLAVIIYALSMIFSGGICKEDIEGIDALNKFSRFLK